MPWAEHQLVLRGEVYNLFNRAQFGTPSNDWAASTFGRAHGHQRHLPPANLPVRGALRLLGLRMSSRAGIGPARPRLRGLEDEIDRQQDAQDAEERREALVQAAVAAGGAVGLGERPEERAVLSRGEEDRR